VEVKDKNMKIFEILLILMFLFHCTSKPPVKINPEVGAVAINLGVNTPLKVLEEVLIEKGAGPMVNTGIFKPLGSIGPIAPHIVFFLKVDPSKPFSDSHEIYFSNFRKIERQSSARIYLFNAKPGYYIAVASLTTVFNSTNSDYETDKYNLGSSTTLYKPSDSDEVTFFSEEIAKSTLIKIEAGQVGYMGKLVVHKFNKLQTVDSLQVHSAKLIKPDALNEYQEISKFYGRRNFLGILSGNEKSEFELKEFELKAAVEEFDETEWKQGLSLKESREKEKESIFFQFPKGGLLLFLLIR
jgi:hypothetical protein